ncbi:hypothetical protein PPROV_000954500 [Pycnococcus provasolii]|uniref:AAA+ ATPase domain-containing protein n=1 Tax=Pycnococcus provasolii TaxID=41880 RepID=A0A830HUD9_9CHLO|nr:hypothetical protein PPROV_000954500 [Pycnococcus provasolii]
MSGMLLRPMHALLVKNTTSHAVPVLSCTHGCLNLYASSPSCSFYSTGGLASLQGQGQGQVVVPFDASSSNGVSRASVGGGVSGTRKKVGGNKMNTISTRSTHTTSPPLLLHHRHHRSSHQRSFASSSASGSSSGSSTTTTTTTTTTPKKITVEITTDTVDDSDEDDDEDAEATEGADMTPKAVVKQLDRYIVGQPDAKRAVAVALRNRWRRHQVAAPMRDEIMPKNILMVGPTGCGKTEIAKRLAKLADAPFLKVEATKFTEVGFHGRDVDQIIRDLVENAIALERVKAKRRLAAAVSAAVEQRLVEALVGADADTGTVEQFRTLLRNGDLDERTVDVEVPPSNASSKGVLSTGGNGELHAGMQELVIKVDQIFGSKGKGGGRMEKRRMTVKEARPILEEMEYDKSLSPDTLARDALVSAEQDGIVVIDEIDKIVSSNDHRHGADASSEGVQRDLLPIVEGTVVNTKYGNVDTSHILFICSGAFHSTKPSDMLAELQGRLPIRVELQGLTKRDLFRILTEPDYNMIRQQQELLRSEGIDLHFEEDAVDAIAQVAFEVNRTMDNIGARRLHTIVEKILEELSFDAPDWARDERRRLREEKGERPEVVRFTVDKAYVEAKVRHLLETSDVSKFIL